MSFRGIYSGTDGMSNELRFGPHRKPGCGPDFGDGSGFYPGGGGRPGLYASGGGGPYGGPYGHVPNNPGAFNWGARKIPGTVVLENNQKLSPASNILPENKN